MCLRNSSVELLRIIAMLLIITHHFGFHGIFHESMMKSAYYTVDHLTWQFVLTQMLCWGGGVGNLIFIFITGYYMIDRKVDYFKILSLILVMTVLSVIILLILYVCGYQFGFFDLIKQIFSIWFGNNWFVSCYVVFSLFIPFINILLKTITKKQFENLLLISFFVFVIIPFLKGNTYTNHAPLLFFSLAYSIGVYIKLHVDVNEKIKHCKFVGGISLVLLLSLIGLFDYLGIYFTNDRLIYFATYSKEILQYPIAICMFIYFLAKKEFYNSLINEIAGTCLGIYLIHDNDLVRPIIWDDCFKNVAFISEWYYPFFVIIKVSIVFVLSSFIYCVISKCIRLLINNCQINKYIFKR